MASSAVNTRTHRQHSARLLTAQWHFLIKRTGRTCYAAGGVCLRQSEATSAANYRKKSTIITAVKTNAATARHTGQYVGKTFASSGCASVVSLCMVMG